MRPTWSSTLWLELIGGVLIVLGSLLAWLAFGFANQSIDPGLNSALLRLRLDFPGFLEALARHVSAVGAVLAGLGAVLFFGAAYLVRFFRLALGVAAVFSVGVWVWLFF